MTIYITTTSKTGKTFTCDVKWQLNKETDSFELTPVLTTE